MPNRYIREAAIRSRAVNSLSWQAEVFWRRLLNLVDDFGRYTAEPDLLLADVFPRQLAKVREADIPRLLAECEKAGLLFRFAAGGKDFLVMNQWEPGRAKVSKYPPPPEEVCQQMQTYVYVCEQIPPTPIPTPIPVPEEDSREREPRAAKANGLAERPSLAEVQTCAGMIGLAAWKAEDWWNEMEGGGWLDFNHRPIADWRAVLRRVKTKWEADGRPSGPPAALGSVARPAGSPAAAGPSKADQVQRSKELDDVLRQIKELQPEGLNTLSGEEAERMRRLKARRKELKALLGYTT